MRRASAAAVALVCFAGVAIQFSATFGVQQDVAKTLWVLLRFFTIITNLLLAIVMAMVASGRRVSPFVLGGATLAILLVGIVYTTLLQGLHELRGPALVADVLLHKVSPVAMAVWWLLFAPRRQLRWNAPLLWATYPLAYFAYALARAQVDRRYPYPFMDVGQVGWPRTVINGGVIALAFVLAGFALVWVDRVRPLGSRRSSR